MVRRVGSDGGATWATLHAEASRLASDADLVRERGDQTTATVMYRKAASAELLALSSLDRSKKSRTYWITAVSAVVLLYKGGLRDDAGELGRQYLAIASVPSFARQQLEELVRACPLRC